MSGRGILVKITSLVSTITEGELLKKEEEELVKDAMASGCPHVKQLQLASDKSFLNPRTWACVECGFTDSVWVRDLRDTLSPSPSARSRDEV